MSQEIDGQQFLVSWDMDSEISAENPVRFVRVFVDALDLQALGFLRTKPAATGRPGYAPEDLLALYVYGHLNRIRSSRMLERECRRNIELWWLLRRQTPDHNTIANFRKENRKPITAAFREFVRLGAMLNLVDGEEICVDGTTLKASNSLKRSTSKALSAQKLAYYRARLQAVERYLETLDTEDTWEAREVLCELDIDPEKLPDTDHLRKQMQLHTQELEQMEREGSTQILYTDPDARVMKTKDGGKRACYNVQTAVDSKSHLAVGFAVTNNANDKNQLMPTAEVVKENLSTDCLHLVADKGYDSAADILNCIEHGCVPDVGFAFDKEQRVFALDYFPAEPSPALLASHNPDDIRRCLHAGVLPDCLQNSNLRISVQYKNQLSCFLRHPDGRVTCPTGKELFPRHERKYGTVYASHEACRGCANPCTSGKNFKEVKFGPDTVYVPVRMYGSSAFPLQQIPNADQPNRYFAFGRTASPDARVILTMRKDIPTQKRRMQISEHPFGTVKHYDGASWFLCRGKEAVAAETALAFLSYNIRRAISLVGGVQKLISAIQGITAPKPGNFPQFMPKTVENRA